MAEQQGTAPPRRIAFASDFTWDGVPVRSYKAPDEGWRGVARQVLFGREEALGFHVRYFEVAPGGYSSLEKHQHAHAVVVLRGRGRAIVGSDCYDVAPFDAVYVAPWIPHQFVNPGDEPFGFLCAVDADRDPPQALSDFELQALRQNPPTRDVVRTGRR